MVQLGFDNTYARDLVGAYAPAPPRGFSAPTLMTWNAELAAELGLPPLEPEQAALLFSGTALSADAEPIALAYAGHQFGGFSPQLGDGRAVLLGEVVDPLGQRWDVQLKGSGPTVYSRGGDGFAALGPILREHLVSHAMHHLGIPTTRVLATVRTGESVRRQGSPDGAVLARIASSHLRVGTFEYFASRGEGALLERLVRYSLNRHAPELLEAPVPAAALLDFVAQRQAALVAAWMGVGFVHGVMNTDNFAISGETLDYGPCAFIDAYDPAAVFSSIDHGGRYAFGNQPAIAQWNLARLGEALLPLIDPSVDAAVARVRQTMGRFADAFSEARVQGLRAKLGLEGEQDGDGPLIDDLLTRMHEAERDHTATFRQLAASLRQPVSVEPDPAFGDWKARWKARIAGAPPAQVADRMDQVNPLYIPRNHRVEAVLASAAEGDLAPFRRLLDVLATPFDAQPGAELDAEPAPADFGPYATFCGT